MEPDKKIDQINQDSSKRIAEVVLNLQKNRDSEEDFDKLYSMTRNMVYYNLIAAAVPAKDRDDIAQNVYIKVLQNLDKLEDPSKIVPWMRKITFFSAMDYFREGYNSKETLQYPWTADDTAGEFDQTGTDESGILMQPICLPEEILENKELQREIRKIIEDLPQKQYSILVSYYFDGCRVKEIASGMGIPEGTVKSYLYRARKTLGDKIEEISGKYGNKLYAFAPAPLITFLLTQAAEEQKIAFTLPLSRLLLLSSSAKEVKRTGSAARMAGGISRLFAGTASRAALGITAQKAGIAVLFTAACAAAAGYTVNHRAPAEPAAVISEEIPETVQELPETVTIAEESSESIDNPQPSSEKPLPVHEHQWEEITEVIHHDAETHTEEIQTGTEKVQTGTKSVERTVHHDAEYDTQEEYGTVYICPVCGHRETSIDVLYEHEENEGHVTYEGATQETALVGTKEVEISPAWEETVYEEEPVYEDRPVYEQRTITDEEAWDETVVTGYQCSVCGEKKER